MCSAQQPHESNIINLIFQIPTWQVIGIDIVRRLIMMDTINSMSLALSIDLSRYLGTQEVFNKFFPLDPSTVVQVLVFPVLAVPIEAQTYSQHVSELHPGLNRACWPALQWPWRCGSAPGHAEWTLKTLGCREHMGPTFWGVSCVFCQCHRTKNPDSFAGMVKGLPRCFISAENDLKLPEVWASHHLPLAFPSKYSLTHSLPWPSVPIRSLNLFVDMFRAHNTAVGFRSVSQIHSRKVYFIIIIQTGSGPSTCLHVMQSDSQFNSS